jgi:hypothetical protein
MTLERDTFIDSVEKSEALKQEALQRARGYSVESGITDAVTKLNLSQPDRHKQVSEYPLLDEGTVYYAFPVDDDHSFNVHVDSKGTVKIQGQLLIGSSKIKREKWLKDPELIGKGLKKAFRHPYPVSGD